MGLAYQLPFSPTYSCVTMAAWAGSIGLVTQKITSTAHIGKAMSIHEQDHHTPESHLRAEEPTCAKGPCLKRQNGLEVRDAAWVTLGNL